MSEANPNKPLKVLLVAEHASATFGGEAFIPFQYFRCLREIGVDVHLLVHARTQKELYNAFPREVERLHFVADSSVNIWCWKIGNLLPDRIATFTLGAISHLDTQIRQRRLARSLVKDQQICVVHEPIPVSPKMPSMMYGLSAPVIIGPMNGGMDYPPNYDSTSGFERFAISILRSASTFWNKIMPGKANAALLLVANKRTRQALPPNLWQKPILELVENGVDFDLFRSASVRDKRERIQFIYVGRLVDFKRVDLLIEACARLVGQVSFHLDIVGDGPLRACLVDQVRRLQLIKHVQFHGLLPQSAAAALLRGADVMVLPSMRECGGAVVLEAMACGVPVVAAEWGGPADYIVDGTGILIPPATPDIFVGKLTDAMLMLAKDPQLRADMGRASRQRVEVHYDWRMKTQAIVQIYRAVASGNRLEMLGSVS
jgi:glycosyltransferase involved in cell wall biosynthesis